MTETQMIADISCIERAKFLNVKLKDHYKQDEDWKTFYFSQLKKASELMKEFNSYSIIRAIIRHNIYLSDMNFVKNKISQEEKIIGLTKET